MASVIWLLLMLISLFHSAITSHGVGIDNNVVEKILRDIPTTHRVVVSKHSGMAANFSTIMDAVEYDAMHAPSKERFVIFIRTGVYHENVTVKRDNVVLIGDGMGSTIITSSLNADDGVRTYNTATLAVEGKRFIAIGAAFVNSAGPSKHQAVAARISADKTAFYQCSFEGYQDTLYTHRGVQFYRACDIYGTVDFIFGNSAASFQSSNFFVRRPLSGQQNTVTAQGRFNGSDKTGFSMHNCSIRAAPDLLPVLNSTKTYLGRPWRNYSNTVFMQCHMDSLVEPNGWLDWDGRGPMDPLFYGEFSNIGPGASIGGRVRWKGVHPTMTASQAMHYTAGNFIQADDWLPQTHIPYFSGLLHV